ncbi:hypothetical protein BDU57DRAFT_298815 [Ampelomyces quisqualis]|uniref:Uncharacterized protein n=1 Tax=Ampelomyces quisqualis TaxID=50730 RepID=A0A6A5QGC1_AMPQU|nr:hypothetical protein BDU57DRAFT_298815 [Ampelomyces quisqualis]
MSQRNSARIIHGEVEYREKNSSERPRSNKSSSTFLTPQLPSAALSTSPSSSGGMGDFSLTSPSVDESVQQRASNTPKRTTAPCVPERTLSSAVRRLVARPRPSKGSANDPILLDEYSPRRKPLSLPTRQEQWNGTHEFQNRHLRMKKPLPPRRALAAKPNNGGTFTGDKGNDMYKIANAKAAVINRIPPVPQSNIDYGMPFEVQYPKSAQFLAKQPAPATQQQSPYTHYHANMGVSLSSESEDMLRKRALQHIRESSRPQHLKKMPPNDPDDTSASETEAPRPHKKLAVYQDPNDDLSPLVSQTALLTTLLQVYPKSADQKGLREDIGMLVSVHQRGVTAWIKGEARKDHGDSAVARARRAVDGLLAEQSEERKRDEEVRSLLSAQAGIWADGSGEGVVDVFAAGDGLDVDKTARAEGGLKSVGRGDVE